MASFEVPDSTGAEVATWAGHTWQQSRRGFSSCSHEGIAIGAGHRRSGRQRITRSKVVGCCSPGSPSRSAGAAVGSSSRRVPSFHRTFSKSVDSLGAKHVVEQKELDAALVRLTRLREEMVRVPSPGPTQPVVLPPPPDPSTAEISVESTSRRVEGRAPQEACKISVGARDRSELMATLNGGIVAGSSNRFRPLA